MFGEGAGSGNYPARAGTVLISKNRKPTTLEGYMTNKLIAIMMTLCFGAVAQVNLTGTVTDAAGGSPLPGVAVVLKTLGISDTTDAQGKYQIIATRTKGAGSSSAKIIPGGRVVGNFLRLNISEPSPVTVELFDATGVKITTLFKDA